MNWLYLLSYFFRGVFFANAAPHFVSGTMGRPFHPPFCKAPRSGTILVNGERMLGHLQCTGRLFLGVQSKQFRLEIGA